MAELRYELNPWPSADQLVFIEAALRNSFKINGFVASSGHLVSMQPPSY